MNTSHINLRIGFAPETEVSELINYYRFSHIPQIGEEVVGDEGIYTITNIIHSNGAGIEEPECTVIIKYSRSC